MSKMKYRISSRATILLGRESVSKVDGALIELIKNTYDADAELCYVFFDISNDTIYIIDNGTGMTKKIIEDNWMMIGTDNKKEKYISYKKRIKSGEKGIGRFALDRLGSVCELYTKHKDESTIYWKTDWNSFEESGKVLNDVEADFEYRKEKFIEFIPNCVLTQLENMRKEKEIKTIFSFTTGTLLKITGIRDKWTYNDIMQIENSLSFLIPPKEQDEYYLCVQKDEESKCELIENCFSDEYDYKITANFDGNLFKIVLDRNEFDTDKIPQEIFKEERFSRYPYRKKDFDNKKIQFEFTIQELFKTDDENLVNKVSEIGAFRLEYIFMKLSTQEDNRAVYFYKSISNNRRNWLSEHGGIKIYRDNFWVRPYGDVNSESFDWLGFDRRNSANPVGVSSDTESWTVRNAQGQGTVFISRISNEKILDKSSREGIIENDSYRIFKQTIIKIISVLEKDRSYIAKTFKDYDDKINERDKTKKEGTILAKEILNKNIKKTSNNDIKSLAKTVKYYEEEREELISEVKLLRSLATNGLITTSIVHDLKTINALLVNRVNSLRTAISMKNDYLINRNLNDLYKDDEFLKSWITVISNQNKKDKRKRLKKNLYLTIEKIVSVLNPILVQKKVVLEISKDNKEITRRIFESDFESIIYNLIINSVEAFTKTDIEYRKINIKLITDHENFIIQYNDNGKGLTAFKDPYEIFKFGTTSKYDKDGNVLGTGLGMYIVATTIREYNGNYKLTEVKKGFGLEISIPFGGR